MPAFTITDDHFALDGQPVRLLSGAMHYFRVLPEQWRDRLEKLRAMGLNTVETYTAWNLHEPRPGTFDFSGMLDLAGYIRLAGELGLHVIVRPGPYICAEWDMGGLPAWLLSDPNMQLRCHYPGYLGAVERYFDALCAELAPLQITRGGPLIAVQVENEYGSYGNDSAYLRWIEAVLRSRGVDVLLFTSDGPGDEYLQCGTLPHLFKTANFGSRPAEAFAKLREYQPGGPLMCMEYWNGWFDHWGEPHHTRPAADAAATLEEMLAAGASVNLYMFHGGTNFGLTSGANEAPYPDYQATVTGYDYDAPLNEAGDATEKFRAFRQVLLRYATGASGSRLQPAPKLPPTPARFRESARLFDTLGCFPAPVDSAAPLPLELLPPEMTAGSANAALILYRAQVRAPLGTGLLVLEDLHDRAQVFVDGAPVGVLERELHQDSLEISIPAGGATLEILVENMGRVNFGPHLLDRKGLLGGARIGPRSLFGWQTCALLSGYLPRLPENLPWRAGGPLEGPAFQRAVFSVENPLDGYLSLPGWGKGLAWVNGFCLGRYWQRGPQQTLFVPGPLLRPGQNELVLLELHHPGEDALFGAPVDLG